VRAYFNDPRIEGSSRAFHFGIDVSAPNGTPVYAVEAGEVFFDNPTAIAVKVSDALDFGYWHIDPVVRPHQRVARHQLLGHVLAPWLHVHFAERRGGEYRNPLRPGALTPFRDATTPRITRIALERAGHALDPTAAHGGVDVVAEAFDPPPLPVPAPWHDLPVTPARIRWRALHRDGRVARDWHTPVDFTQRLLPRERFDAVYAHGTRQNHANQPGLYRFFLAHTWDTRLYPDGRYRVEVEASDLAGNTGRAQLDFAIANGV
jgi:hypothetical protein